MRASARLTMRMIILFVLASRYAGAQATDSSRGGTAMLSGIVHDSLAHRPLAGAIVQVVSEDTTGHFGRTTTSDSLGRFVFANIPSGRYMLGFFHPVIDSLGVEPPPREIFMDGSRPLRADLAIPAAARLREAICGPDKSPRESSAVVVGVVRDARDHAPAAAATVTGEWLEYTLSRNELTRRAPRLSATTGANGWFALCNVPAAGNITLQAARGTDSTDLIEVQIPADGFIRRELFVGAARAIVSGDAPRTDTVALAPRRRVSGDMGLSGVVVTGVAARPLAGATVGIADGPHTRTNDLGEWTLTQAPGGTRMLEVRAIGYFPVRRPVDVIADAAPVRVALSTMQAMLDTIKVAASASGLKEYDSGFEDRRRTGAGHFLGPNDITLRSSINTSDVFRFLPGMRVERNSDGFDKSILMRGPFGFCSPSIFMNGRYMPLTAEDIDDWVSPKYVKGIEVYSEAEAPPQFKDYTNGDNTCGSIVIWTKPRR